MSGGIHALRGFDYQATVVLDRLLDHFDRHGATATIRPEGIDDLDLEWTDTNGSPRKRFEQIKKPREDQNGLLQDKPWSLSEVSSEIVTNTVRNLRGNSHEQVWILGDGVEADVEDLVHAGMAAPIRAAAYWRLVHILARSAALDAVSVDARAVGRITRWRIPSDLPPDPDDASARLFAEFSVDRRGIGTPLAG